jgi:sirohydrochlorin cobaltochelatase
MEEVKSPYAKLVLVCTNVKEDGTCCGAGGGDDLRVRLKEAAKAAGLPVRVSKSGCLGQCPVGPNVVVMPDNRWFSHVSDADLDAILQVIRGNT